MEAKAFPVVASVSQTEAGRMAACRFYTVLSGGRGGGGRGLFWVVFWQLVALQAADLDSDLLTMLKRVWWQCQFVT